MTDTLNPAKVKALELAIHSPGAHAEVVERAGAYHTFLTGGSPAPAGAATKPGATTGGATAGGKANGATAPDAAAAKKAAAEKAAAEKAAAEKAAAEKKAAEKAAADKAAAGKANGAGKPGDKPAGKNPPSAQSIPADTKAPGGKHTYADVVALLHKVQNSPAGRPECFKILLEDGGSAKSVRDLKPAFYDAVVEACENVISDEGEPAGEAAADESDPLGEMTGGGGERDDMGLT